MHETTARAAAALWPPEDTEESVLGTNIHQDTIVAVRGGINQAASRAKRPWRAGGQTNVAGFFRPDGSAYTTLPDVFVYRVPFDRRRATLSLALDGAPALVVEVLSPETYSADLDLERGKGYSYRRGGVAEYLTLDPLGRYLREQGRGWRLAGGAYVPWGRDAAGRWASDIGFAVGFEGVLAERFGSLELGAEKKRYAPTPISAAPPAPRPHASAEAVFESRSNATHRWMPVSRHWRPCGSFAIVAAYALPSLWRLR